MKLCGKRSLGSPIGTPPQRKRLPTHGGRCSLFTEADLNLPFVQRLGYMVDWAADLTQLQERSPEPPPTIPCNIFSNRISLYSSTNNHYSDGRCCYHALFLAIFLPDLARCETLIAIEYLTGMFIDVNPKRYMEYELNFEKFLCHQLIRRAIGGDNLLRHSDKNTRIPAATVAKCVDGTKCTIPSLPCHEAGKRGRKKHMSYHSVADFVRAFFSEYGDFTNVRPFCFRSR